MVRISARRRKHEAGQAILLVVLAMSIVLLGSLGFVIDGSHLYAQRVMAQAAADAAAQAGIMSISNRTAGAFGTYATFDGANWVTSGGTPLTSGSIIPCSTSGMSTSAACTYAQILDGFNLAGDAVTVTINPTA
ncbi:MAG TPA: pilus assembly protein TadG-related protein, partial [Bryobacteraceae bacterium]|nr:pilus assembly protein TadG-related protein [Bryobacteraceae bacterium]